MDEGTKPCEIRLFGGIEARTPQCIVSGRDFGGIKQRHILALLTLYGTLSKDHLAELLWEGTPPAEYVATLESYVSQLRRRLDPTSPGRRSVVVTRQGGYALNLDRAGSDVGRFDQLMLTAARLTGSDALNALATAVDLASAPLLADEPYLSWAIEARQRYRVRLIDAATQAAEYAMDLGLIGQAQALASRATDLDPLAERAWFVRMLAYRGADDRAAALRCYESLRRALADELGVAPGAAAHTLFLDILRTGSSGGSDLDGLLDGLVGAIMAAAKELAVREEPTGWLAGQVVHLITQAHTLVQTGSRQQLALHATG
jgi:DNA-binding SARP family transcriptional activator